MIRARLDAELTRPRLRPDVELAVALSVATRIETELVRAVRLTVLPHLDVGAESDFWFSEWVGARQPQVVALRQELLEPLRERLGVLFRAGALGSLREVIRHVHQTISPALQLEEDVNWRVYTGQEGGVPAACALLRKGTKAMVDGGREGVAGWVAEAKDRLPPQVMASADGWQLVLQAKWLRPNDITEEIDEDSEHLLQSVLMPVAHGKTPRHMRGSINLRWQGDVLELGGDFEGAVTIPMPHHVPPWVELTEHGSTIGTWLLADRRREFRPSVKGPVRLRTLDGRVFHVPDAVGDSVQASPVLVRMHGPEGEPARFWLQPVRFDTDARASSGQPIALLGKVLSTIPADDGALQRLRTWLDIEDRAAVRLVHGWTEEQRLRLATQIAAEAGQAGWRVYRGRQDPEAAHWLSTGKPDPGTRGLLLVVDRADTWHPRHLQDLLAALTDDAMNTRVLLLGTEAGFWWNALTRALGGVETAVQQLVQRDRTGDQLFSRALDVLAGTMEVDLTSLRKRRVALRTDVEHTAVAAALDTLTRRTPSFSRVHRAILHHEQNYRASHEPEHRDVLAQLIFLATLLRPLELEHARSLALLLGLSDEDEWSSLLAAYERHYPLDQDVLDPLGGSQLGDDLLACVLVDDDDLTGVSRSWALTVLESLDRSFKSRAVGVLAHASDRFPALALQHMNPLLRVDPGLLVDAGPAAMIAATRHADTDLLRQVSAAVPPPQRRDLRLDPAVAQLEKILAQHSFRQGTPGPHRDAPVFLRLARSQARAGFTEAALTSAHQASEQYRRLTVTGLRTYTTDLCESLILESELLGELGRAGEAFSIANDAERRMRGLQRKLHERPGANLGVALANLGRQKARAHGDAQQAYLDVSEAVRILRGLANGQSAEYEPELAEALVNLSDRAHDAGRLNEAMSSARDAVTLCRSLSSRNAWAHGYRLAASLRCLAALVGLSEALPHTSEAVTLYRRAASAAPERFSPLLASALVHHAEVVLSLGSGEDARALAEEAISLYSQRARGNSAGFADELAAAVALRDRCSAGSP
ncbi:hypothetical protein LFM09_01220 [Lentzea alba]|uniref:hypothetical protein n=1 Tax=Lentzea alba TaxID=2714351 RepID=UPI0039BFC8B6